MRVHLQGSFQFCRMIFHRNQVLLRFHDTACMLFPVYLVDRLDHRAHRIEKTVPGQALALRLSFHLNSESLNGMPASGLKPAGNCRFSVVERLLAFKRLSLY
jgi:hypothetical protein